MKWEVVFCYDTEEQIYNMPLKLKVRMLRLLELMECHGVELGAPHTKGLGAGLFEVRAKATEGIGRSLYSYSQYRQILILLVFVKKSSKIPKNEYQLARKRQKEVNNNEYKTP